MTVFTNADFIFCEDDEMRRILIVILLALIISLAGCFCRDGSFTYNCTVTILDLTGQPVENIRTFATDDAGDFPQTYAVEAPTRIALTNAAGVAEPGVATDLTWGGCPGPSEAPVPPNPGVLFLWIEHPQQGWQRYDLNIQDEHITGRRPAELDINLGTITLF
jgi:hypothetical protein